ncbi:MAG: hypothetical protein KC777_23510 [Cyanobacteria bacterium HKST-UBA02]|nr:hypothetical protein [Cyanobacteria bacterium HKST-UBA02]
MKSMITYIVAGNPNTPEKVLRKLAESGDSRIRRHVAENEAVTAGLLELLAWDSDPEVRVAAVSNRRCPRYLVEELLRTGDNQTLFLLAMEKWAPLDVLGALAESENPFISFQARETLSIKTRSVPVLN